MEKCSICKLPITADAVVSEGKVFHPECMKCCVCGDTIRGQYFFHQGEPICEMHHKIYADKCSVCGEVPSGRYYSIDEEVFCEECHLGQSEKCPRCKEVVLEKMVKYDTQHYRKQWIIFLKLDSSFRITGATFHSACFTCVVCKRNMAHSQFVADDKMQIFCPDDYNRYKTFI